MENTNQVEYFMEDIRMPKFNQIYYLKRDVLYKLDVTETLTQEFVRSRHKKDIDSYNSLSKNDKGLFNEPKITLEVNDDKLIVIVFMVDDNECDPHTYIQSK